MRNAIRMTLGGFAVAAMFATSASAGGTVMYDAVPDPSPSNVVSLGYQATQTSEFGQAITLASTGPLDSVTVTMSSWACQVGAWNTGDCVTVRNADGSLPTFLHAITVTVYEADGATVIGSVTETVAVPFRPSRDVPECATGYVAADLGRCTDGYAFNATFDFPGLTLPADVVVGVEYSTAGDGPADSLNVGLTTAAPTTGTAGDIYWDSTYQGRTGGFTNDDDWGYNVMIRLETAPSAQVTADDCKNGGFEQYGFSNQGQCVASVKANENAGK